MSAVGNDLASAYVQRASPGRDDTQTHWITRFFEKRKGLTPEGMVTRKLVSRLFDQTGFASFAHWPRGASGNDPRRPAGPLFLIRYGRFRLLWESSG